jgi:hypothetical protein
MKPMHLAGFLLAAYAAVPMSAQSNTMRAEIRSNYSDRGKCTIEVEVDGVADVEVSGDRGRIRTLSGQTATWRRMVCSQPLPRNPIDFQFKGVDGRGRVQLVQDPRSRGVAVVRIEDTKGGREGYTFDLEWNGGTYDNSGGWGNDDVYRGDRRGRDDGWNSSPGWGNGNGTYNNRPIDFRGSGDGYIRTSNRNERLRGLDLEVRNNGRVRAQFQTDRGDTLSMDGRVTRFDNGRLYADMSGRGLNGSMVISIDRNDRVRDVSMSGFGRDQFELRWRD